MYKRAFITGIAALFVTSCQAPMRTAHARTLLPDTITGEWCYVEGDYDNQPIISRRVPPICEGGDHGLYIDQEVVEGEESYTVVNVKQIGPNAFLVYLKHDDNKIGPMRLELVGDKLHFSWAIEG
jgi:hypothetical protein